MGPKEFNPGPIFPIAEAAAPIAESKSTPMNVKAIDDIGIPCKAREAIAFALLAWWNSVKYPGSTPEVTGAQKAAVLGQRVDPN